MARRKKGDPISGWVMFNKPHGMGSTQAVSFVRRIFNAQKAGHGGTLDPLAEGVLPIALGEATKTMPYMLDEDKTYQFTVKWGSETDTCDLEGEVIQSSESRPSEAQFKTALNGFLGDIEQVPPAYSALKIDGKRACDRVRAGEEVEMKSRPVTIYDLTVVEFSSEEATISATVSKGTYIRSLARDLGRELGCYGHVTELIRTKVNKFALNDCVCKEKLDEASDSGHIPQTFLLPVDSTLADIPVIEMGEEKEKRLKLGNPVVVNDVKEGLYRAKNLQGKLLSLVKVENDEAKPIRNFNL